MIPDNNSEPKAQAYQNVKKTDQQWQQLLSPEQYRILRKKGTEAPYSGEYDKFFKTGAYYCAGCGSELFTSEDKFDSGCGWPAFSKPADGEKVKETTDLSHAMVRTEITCRKCNGHLGHVFEDGPKPSGLRYCINSAALKFNESKKSRLQRNSH